jgi:hypothetical protein
MNWLKKLATDTFEIVLKTGICGAVVVAVGFSIWFWMSGWANYAAPKVPAPPAPEPLKITLHGPHLVIAGVPTVFTVEVSGNASQPKWDFLSEGDGSIAPYGDFKQADLITNNEGVYSLLVSVAGEAMQQASAKMKVMSIPQVTSSDVPPLPPAPMPNPPVPQPQPTMTISQATVAALAKVNSPNRAAEAHTLAGSISTTGGRITGRFLGWDASTVAAELKKAAMFQLQDKFQYWSAFIDETIANLAELQRSGVVFNAATTVQALNEIAGVLLADR